MATGTESIRTGGSGDGRQKNRWNWATVAVSLWLAVALWFLVTLRNQVFRYEISYPVKLVNVPPGATLSSVLPDRWRFLCEGRGSRLLVEKLKHSDDTISIDYRKYAALGYFTPWASPRELNQAGTRGVRFVEAWPDTLFLRFERKNTKKVKVVSAIELSFPRNFRIPGEPQFLPDSVLLEGPEEMLAKTDTWRTVPMLRTVGENRIQFTIALDSSSLVRAWPRSVEVIVTPVRYTEVKLRLPVEWANPPRDRKVRLEPAEIDAWIQVPLSDADTLSAASFHAVVDGSHLGENTRFLIPQVTSRNPRYVVTRSQPSRIDFLIITQK